MRNILLNLFIVFSLTSYSQFSPDIILTDTVLSEFRTNLPQGWNAFIIDHNLINFQNGLITKEAYLQSQLFHTNLSLIIQKDVECTIEYIRFNNDTKLPDEIMRYNNLKVEFKLGNKIESKKIDSINHLVDLLITQIDSLNQLMESYKVSSRRYNKVSYMQRTKLNDIGIIQRDFYFFISEKYSMKLVSKTWDINVYDGIVLYSFYNIHPDTLSNEIKLIEYLIENLLQTNIKKSLYAP